jgi:hypothetical protein
MAKKIQLNYLSPAPRRKSPFNGVVALAFSFTPLLCYGGVFILQTAKINFEMPEIAALAIGVAAMSSWFLSFVFASFALHDGGRSRTMGFWAIGISLGLLLIPVALNLLLNH